MAVQERRGRGEKIKHAVERKTQREAADGCMEKTGGIRESDHHERQKEEQGKMREDEQNDRRRSAPPFASRGDGFLAFQGGETGWTPA
eukprot:3902367-Pleurochrysis_carterae.AAC.2